jgi:hypothetical protein
MSVTITTPGIRVANLPDLGVFNDDSSVVGERAGSGRFSAGAILTYVNLSFGSIAALRLNARVSAVTNVTGYATPNDGGGGTFVVVPTDTTSADDGGTIVVDALSQRWYRQTGDRAFSVRWFGAKGDGTTNDSPAFQAAINAAVLACRALYVPGAVAHYHLTTPLNMTNMNQFVMFGDGSYPCTARITPAGGSVLGGATGAGVPVIDAMGSNGLTLRNLTIASIGLTNASTVGVIHGTTPGSVNGGSSCVYDDVSILLPATGASIGIYGVCMNLGNFRGLNIMADRCLYLTDTNNLGITPPFGIYGTDIDSDGNYGSGCALFGYGVAVPFVLRNCVSATFDQLYIVNINGGPGYTGQPYAMELENVTDVRIKTEIDYFPSAVHQLGTWLDVDLSGIIYQWNTPMATNQPSVVGFNGILVRGGRIVIRGLAAMPSNVAYGTASTSPTFQNIIGTELTFDTAINPNVAFFDFTGTNPFLLFNVKMTGNTDGPPMTFQLNGVPLTTAQYRIWINGIRTGIA